MRSCAAGAAGDLQDASVPRTSVQQWAQVPSRIRQRPPVGARSAWVNIFCLKKIKPKVLEDPDQPA